MWKIRIVALSLLIASFGLGYFITTSEQGGFGARFPFRFGLDLSGGTHLTYRADISELPQSDIKDSMEALRDVIERRVNLFGVSEPIVQVETTAGIISDQADYRLIVELPGVTDIDQAVAMIGQTPFLEFRLEGVRDEENGGLPNTLQGLAENEEEIDLNTLFVPTDLTGRYLERATVGFDSLTNEPRILLDFNKVGEKLFADITKENIGKTLAIYLDGAPISLPVIREEIRGGRAEISGTFTIPEVKQLVGRLNSGALPIPIELLGSQTIGASLGKEAQEKGVRAGFFGILAVALFMVIWYRLPGLVSVISLGIYVVIMLILFKLIPVTLTTAGIAGFILSIGMAVDANVLIFERLKEELRSGKNIHDATKEGFSRAWVAIRDSNISSIITAIILFWFGTSLIEGFALVFGLGVLVSMTTAVSVTRTLLLAISKKEAGNTTKFLFGTGFFIKASTETSTEISQ